jgi:hypothetical protein
MVFPIFLMLVATGLGVAIVGLVALPARREGKGLLTPAGAARFHRHRGGRARIP